MKAKLIKYKQEMFTNYILKNENGDTIATTKYPFAAETEYLAKSKGITLQKLSLKNCEAIANDYDLDELSQKEADLLPNGASKIEKLHLQIGFKQGAKAILELLGDKKFTFDQMILVAGYAVGLSIRSKSDPSLDIKQEILDFIGKIEQTEGDVEIEMEDVMTFASMPKEGEKRVYQQPKLDAENCLILKRL